LMNPVAATPGARYPGHQFANGTGKSSYAQRLSIVSWTLHTRLY
jgi:hypothetical protein